MAIRWKSGQGNSRNIQEKRRAFHWPTSKGKNPKSIRSVMQCTGVPNLTTWVVYLQIDLKTFTNWEDSPEKMMMDMMGNPNAPRKEER